MWTVCNSFFHKLCARNGNGLVFYKIWRFCHLEKLIGMNLDSMLTMEQSQLKKTIAKFTKKIAVQIGASKSANTKYIEPKIQHVLDFKTLQNICAVQYMVWRHTSESGNCHLIKKIKWCFVTIIILCWFLEPWNRVKSLTLIWQHFSCQLNIEKKNRGGFSR